MKLWEILKEENVGKKYSFKYKNTFKIIKIIIDEYDYLIACVDKENDPYEDIGEVDITNNYIFSEIMKLDFIEINN